MYFKLILDILCELCYTIKSLRSLILANTLCELKLNFSEKRFYIMITIKNKDKATVLAALYNQAPPAGIGLSNFSNLPMTSEDASHFLERQTKFYYLNGRALMVDLSSNLYFNEKGYDKIYGTGSAQKAVDTCPDIKE